MYCVRYHLYSLKLTCGHLRILIYVRYSVERMPEAGLEDGP